MFNLLVSGSGDWWETAPLASSVDRFKEYSGASSGKMVDAARPETLRRLEEIPTLLMYEANVGGPHAQTVRHGRLRNIVRRGRELTFDFDLDPERPYLDRRTVLTFAPQLGIEPFEQHRTHWAIKDGNLPPDLLTTGTAERVERTVRAVAAEYVGASREGQAAAAKELADELEAFPATLEKALLLLPSRILISPIPEFYPILGIEPRTPEGRTALKSVLALTAGAGAGGPSEDWPFSLAWFIGLYGSPTEESQLAAAVEQCAVRVRRLGTMDAEDPGDVEQMAYALWRSSRSPLLAGRLRREIAMVVERLVRRQAPGGFWIMQRDGIEVAGVRATALATVALQRLGDDRHHEAIRAAVRWLINQVAPESGALERFEGDAEPDVMATTLALEAMRRSDLAEDVLHVLEAGDAWLVAAQTARGGWKSEPWSGNFVTACVLDYLVRRSDLLPQVDGFLLMARDFFRKAEELRLEGGANNRRLAAIAAVHAVEMFLYGLFERRDDLALSAFRENGTETLGPREALGALQVALQRIGTLRPPQRLPHRDQLSSLVGRRDGIIHRAHEISAAELDAGISHARRFVTHFGKELLQLDLLQ